MSKASTTNSEVPHSSTSAGASPVVVSAGHHEPEGDVPAYAACQQVRQQTLGTGPVGPPVIPGPVEVFQQGSLGRVPCLDGCLTVNKVHGMRCHRPSAQWIAPQLNDCERTVAGVGKRAVHVAVAGHVRENWPPVSTRPLAAIGDGVANRREPPDGVGSHTQLILRLGDQHRRCPQGFGLPQDPCSSQFGGDVQAPRRIVVRHPRRGVRRVRHVVDVSAAVRQYGGADTPPGEAGDLSLNPRRTGAFRCRSSRRHRTSRLGPRLDRRRSPNR